MSETKLIVFLMKILNSTKKSPTITLKHMSEMLSESQCSVEHEKK